MLQPASPRTGMAGTAIPHIPQREHDCQQRYAAAHSSLLLLDYLEEERGRRERLIVQNEHWTALVPYWAVWPYEVLFSRINTFSASSTSTTRSATHLQHS